MEKILWTLTKYGEISFFFMESQISFNLRTIWKIGGKTQVSYKTNTFFIYGWPWKGPLVAASQRLTASLLLPLPSALMLSCPIASATPTLWRWPPASGFCREGFGKPLHRLSLSPNASLEGSFASWLPLPSLFSSSILASAALKKQDLLRPCLLGKWRTCCSSSQIYPSQICKTLDNTWLALGC